MTTSQIVFFYKFTNSTVELYYIHHDCAVDMKVFSMRGVLLYWLELKHWITDLLRDVSTQMEHNAVGEGGGGGGGGGGGR